MSIPVQTTLLLGHLRELWVHTGTTCNLSCPFCHEGSKPGDTRLAAPTLAQLAPHFEEAAARGVTRFGFTGGEPLIHKAIVEILLSALKLAPALVLTNGTAPLIRRPHHLALLRAAPHALSFRVSIDYPEEARHDAGRGLKNFRKALEGLRLLHAAGFEVGITRQASAGEDAGAVAARFRQLLRKQRLPEDMSVVALPELGALGDTARDAAVSGPGLVASRPTSRPDPACTTGRMLLSRQGVMRFHACPLTDDEQRFDLGGTLEQAAAAPVTANHPRCALCLGPGVDYGGNAA